MEFKRSFSTSGNGAYAARDDHLSSKYSSSSPNDVMDACDNSCGSGSTLELMLPSPKHLGKSVSVSNTRRRSRGHNHCSIDDKPSSSSSPSPLEANRRQPVVNNERHKTSSRLRNSSDVVTIPRNDNGNSGDNHSESCFIEIIAPSGRLGIAVDPQGETSHIIKVNNDSVLRDRIRLGDEIVAIDDEDVEGLTPVHVSMILGRKSQNAERKITISRNDRHVHHLGYNEMSEEAAPSSAIALATVPTVTFASEDNALTLTPTTSNTALDRAVTTAVSPATRELAIIPAISASKEALTLTANAATDIRAAAVGTVVEIEITALTGKLGISITDEDNAATAADITLSHSTPNCDLPLKYATACCVSRVRDDSMLRNIIYIGDRIVGVDDQDVSKWKGVYVSKLLGSKSGNAMRIITVLRNVTNNDHEEPGGLNNSRDGHSNTDVVTSANMLSLIHSTSGRIDGATARHSPSVDTSHINDVNSNPLKSRRGTNRHHRARSSSRSSTIRSRSLSADHLSVAMDASPSKHQIREAVDNDLKAQKSRRGSNHDHTTGSSSRSSTNESMSRSCPTDHLAGAVDSSLSKQRIREAVDNALKAHSIDATRFQQRSRHSRTAGVSEDNSNRTKAHQEEKYVAFCNLVYHYLDELESDTKESRSGGKDQRSWSIVDKSCSGRNRSKSCQPRNRSKSRPRRPNADNRGRRSTKLEVVDDANQSELKSCLRSSSIIRRRGSDNGNTFDTRSKPSEEESRLRRSKSSEILTITSQDHAQSMSHMLSDNTLKRPNPPSSYHKRDRMSSSEGVTSSEARMAYYALYEQARESFLKTSIQTHRSCEYDSNDITIIENAKPKTTGNVMDINTRFTNENNAISSHGESSSPKQRKSHNRRFPRGRSNTRHGRNSSSKSSSRMCPLGNSAYRENESNDVAATAASNNNMDHSSNNSGDVTPSSRNRFQHRSRSSGRRGQSGTHHSRNSSKSLTRCPTSNRKDNTSTTALSTHPGLKRLSSKEIAITKSTVSSSNDETSNTDDFPILASGTTKTTRSFRKSPGRQCDCAGRDSPSLSRGASSHALYALDDVNKDNALNGTTESNEPFETEGFPYYNPVRVSRRWI